MKYISVYDRYGLGLSLFPEVAEQLGLRPGQRVDDETYHRALRLNCETGIAICELNIAITDQNKAAEDAEPQQ